MPHIHVDLQIASESSKLPSLPDIERWVSAALIKRTSELEISIRIVDITEGAKLNQQWRNKSGPTNVLSFPADLPVEVGLSLLGDLVICAPTVEEESKEQGKSLQAHWAHIVIHGTLHLLGYDHIEDDQARLMESLEVKIMKSIGFPDPYQDNNC
ncbi:MAG: rRNA maturation RNase YbeY [Candidatus Endonucleobacter sp. (ex Gigantidas childressi)]|nr:rRNA maturation RNase YbeY [Candidatus Endonucleobacter sp. (ex Gigantidas childressi)]